MPGPARAASGWGDPRTKVEVPAWPTLDAAGYPSPARAWLSIGILLAFSLVSILDRGILALMVEPIKTELALSDTQLGLLQGFAFTTCYSLAGGIAGLDVAALPHRPPRAAGGPGLSRPPLAQIPLTDRQRITA